MFHTHDFPILEFDANPKAKIEPYQSIERTITLPEKLIVTFFQEQMDRLLKEGKITFLFTIPGENRVTVYRFVTEDVAIVMGTIGCPGCAEFFEDFIAYGVKKVMFCGGGGALRKDLTVGKLIVVEDAIRDEGFSYHYVKPSRYIQADPDVVRIILAYLKQQHVDALLGRTWTTDAFYRETEERIATRTKEGALIVEMEQAGMLAVAQFRKVRYGAILYCGDDVSQIKWDNRKWRSRDDIRAHLIELCLAIVQQL